MKNKTKEFLEYLAIFLFYKISRILGLKISSMIGGLLLFFYGKFSSKNKIALNNLSKAFPEKTKNEKKIIINKMWFHFGRVIGEYPHLDRIKVLNNNYVKIEGLDNLLNSLRKNKNCLFFSAHLGNWELTSHPLTQSGYNISFIYRAPNNVLVDNLLRKIREGYGVGLIKKGPSGAKKCISILQKKNGNIGMLIDQKMNDGIETRFFGFKTMTASAIAKFSLKFKCPIIPAVCKRVNGNKFIIKYFSPISYKKISSLKTELKVMNFLNKYVEEWIKENPEQWIWVHNRW